MRIIILCLALLQTQGINAQVTLNVPSANFPTIQSAVDASSAGDTVLVAPGTYVENVVWPAHDIYLLGSGPSTCIIDGNQSGSCVRFTGDVEASILEGFKLTNGSGSPGLIGLTPQAIGGGLQILGGLVNPTSGVLMSPTIRNCEISGNQAVEGGGVMLRSCSVVFEDCLIQNNLGLSAPPGFTYSAFSDGVFAQADEVTFERCIFRSHGGAATCRFEDFQPDVTFTNCLFDQNSSESVVTGSFRSLSLSKSTFSANQSSSIVAVTASSGVGAVIVDSCLFESNSSVGGIAWFGAVASSNCYLQNSTFWNNTVGAPYGVVIPYQNTHITNCNVWGNVDDTGANAKAFYLPNGVAGNTVQYSNLQRKAGSGPVVVDIDPQLSDPANGDFRLKPGSPMIDSGTLTPPVPLGSSDLRGLPRVRGAGVDVGAFEAQHLAHHDAAAGRVGELAGGPYDILTLNNSNGGLWRKIEVPLGAAATLEVAQPPHLTGPLHFSVFGIFGEANFETVENIGLGIGDMMFLPAPALPFFHPSFFTLASTVGPLGFYAPLFPATPTPWTSALGPSIPFPFIMTIQGVLEEAPGVFVPTNALIYEIK